MIYAATGTASLAIPPAVAIGLAPRLFFQRRHATAARRAARRLARGDPRRARQPRRRPHLASLAVLCSATSGPLPLRSTWQRYERNAAALDVATALELARAELADPVSDRVIEAFVAAHEHGRDVIVVGAALPGRQRHQGPAGRSSRSPPARPRSAPKPCRRDPAVRRARVPRRRERQLPLLLPTTGGWIVVTVGVAMAIGGWKLITVLGRDPRRATRPRRDGRSRADGRPSVSLVAVAGRCRRRLPRPSIRSPATPARVASRSHTRPCHRGRARHRPTDRAGETRRPAPSRV